jgi:hypothetical protein
MALRRLTMALVVVTAGGFAAIHPDAVKAFYENIYPSDPVKQQALDMCFMEDHKFNRLDASERDACYKRTMFTLGEVSPSGAAQPGVNLVDLHRVAGGGSMPRNDILRLQEDQAAAQLSR